MNRNFRYISLIALMLAFVVFASSCSILLSVNPLEKYTLEQVTQNVVTDPEFTDENVDPNFCEHSYSEWVIIKEGGCLGVDQIKERKCSICQTVEQTTSYSEGHLEIVDDSAREATCTAEGLSAGQHCANCGEVILAPTVIPLRSHTYDSDIDADCNICGFLRDLGCLHANIESIEGRSPTCTEIGFSEGKKCADCGEIVEEQTILEALGHTPQIIEGYEPTETEQGLSDGKICAVCDKILLSQRPITALGYSDLSKYSDDYGYNALLELANGEKMQELYRGFDEEAEKFHTDTTIDAKAVGENYVVAQFDFSSLGLTKEDAVTVWNYYRTDHPLYYWISAKFTYNSTIFNLLCADDYATGEAREEYNQLVFDKVREYTASLGAEKSPYRIALALHDAIITNTAYAYKSDGKSPEDAEWAHNVIGIFEKGLGVCESYAKVFQLLLNYCGVENLLVAGIGDGADHAWNMAKMDDGEWYWFDLTWDDTPEWMWGISYNYFCVNDDEDVSQMDGPWTTAPKTFESTHVYFTPEDDHTDRQYSLPKRSAKTIELEQVLTLRECFESEGARYAVIAFDKVQLVALLTGGEIYVPESVIYDDTEYAVVSVGGMSGKLFKSTPIEVKESVTSITLPATVSFIWDEALMLEDLISISVSDENQYYTAKDTVLFTKNLYTLVQYPIGSMKESYVIPDETVELANFSFGDGTVGKLRSITFGASLARVSTLNAGYGHRTSDRDKLNLAGGDMFYLMGLMNFQGEIKLSEKNESFILEDGALYDADKTVLYAINDKNITSFTCPETLKTIDVGAFFGCTRLRIVNINSSLEEISNYAFAYCSRLQTIAFAGTKDSWESIEKKSNWSYQSSAFKVTFGE